MSKDKFFFEEDPEASEESSLNWTEHAATFFHALEDHGLIEDRPVMDLAPMTPTIEMNTAHKVTSLVDIEYGTVKADYAIHITPIHPRKNLIKEELLHEAVRLAVVLLNRVIPTSSVVSIFMPRKDWEIKVISFVVKDGADTWNLDTKKIEEETVPQLLEEIGKICMKA